MCAQAGIFGHIACSGRQVQPSWATPALTMHSAQAGACLNGFNVMAANSSTTRLPLRIIQGPRQQLKACLVCRTRNVPLLLRIISKLFVPAESART